MPLVAETERSRENKDKKQHREDKEALNQHTVISQVAARRMATAGALYRQG